ncbi:MAG: response regulator [Bacteroidetes bacterium]|nr:response regulator [Rhodothermia bacterium]MCS7154684.1 response regulator [Bacteroidota bacterium]MCX7907159.1 response regulator [Bacteroidota bacterium]MDW8137477.1 response regulator [Bacteroidota bacterium]MDW8285569.1 response regulator [Bacteroidota bacterium]
MPHKPAHILIVDDQEFNRDLLVQRLRREGYEPEAAESGPQALACIARRVPDLILLDIMMPGLSGYELISILRAQPATQEVPIILVSAKGETEDIVQGLSLGANDYVTKPVNLPVLKARIETQLRLRRSLEQVRMLSQEKDEILSVVSHDLRSPLSGIAALSRLLLSEEMGPLTSLQREALQDIAQTGERLLRLVNELLDWARLQAGQQEPNWEPISLGELLSESVQALRGAALERGVRLLWTPPETAITILGDSTWLFQIFSNLIGNAIKFSPAGGAVTIRLEHSAEQVNVEISDEGPGIPPEELERIFTRFYTGSRAGPRKGAGLGLHICKVLTERLQGQISVENRTEGGARFRVRFPVQRSLPAAVS